MKKLLIFFLLPFFVVSGAFAASPSPTPTNSAASEDLIQQIDELKDKVASRVAELKLVEKRGVIGTVTDVSDTQLTLEDLNGNVRFVDVDELTKFESSEKASFGISDVKKGMQLGVLGLYNKESRRLLARFIEALDLPKVYQGVVMDKNEDAFTVSFITDDNDELTVDVENITRTFEYAEDGSLVKGGFTKISVDQNAVVVGFPDSKDPKKIAASRIIIFPGVPKNPKIIFTPSPSPAQTKTSTTSASKKPSPTPTPKQ